LGPDTNWTNCPERMLNWPAFLLSSM
jgi:hypothetical protein